VVYFLGSIIDLGIPEEVIGLEKESKNTRDHALFVSNLAQNQGYKELIIITSGYHLLRGYLTFLKEVLAQHYLFSLYGYPAGSTLTWLARSPTEGTYRFLLFFVVGNNMLK
jgi:uncharacterized SAM-binding protein YcdF (DUF218 family)